MLMQPTHRHIGFLTAGIALLVFASACTTPETASETTAPVAVYDSAADSLRFPGETHLRNVRQLTFGGNNAEAYWSYDSRQLTFQSDFSGINAQGCDQIFVVNIDGTPHADGSPYRLASTGKGRTTCSYFTPEGRVLYAHGGKPTGVREIDRDQKVVWSYESKCPQVLGCRRTAEGNTLVAEQGPCQVVEVDKEGKVVRTTPLTTTEKGYHLQVRNVHKLENGNILAAHEGEGAAREYDPSGKVVWEITKIENCGDAVRLANGNTLVSCGTQKRIIEVDPKGKIVWEFGATDAPELNLTWIESFPYPEAKGEYVFFIDFDGHREDPKVRKAIAAMEATCEVVSVLGSFPHATPADE